MQAHLQSERDGVLLRLGSEGELGNQIVTVHSWKGAGPGQAQFVGLAATAGILHGTFNGT